MKTTPFIALGTCLLAASPALAAPGDLLVTEGIPGNVLEISAGGDFTDAERFATGLSRPTGICIGPGGHIYVAETGTGQITIIDDGGDFTDVAPFAFGVAGIASLWCSDDRIVISCPLCTPTGIIEIDPEGGNILTSVEVLALELPLPGDVVFDATGDLFVAARDVYDITAGGSFETVPPYTTGATMLSAMNRQDVLLGGEFQGARIWDFTAGGDLTDVAPWATLPVDPTGIQAVLHHADVGTYAMLGNAVYDVGEGGDLTSAAPFATGLDTGLQGLQGMAAHVCSTHEDCADADLCNGGERCVDNACQPATGPLECDDDNVCTADSCDAVQGCLNDAIAGCCLVDLDCALDELCDAGSNACVPTQVPPTDDETGEDGEDDEDAGEGSDGTASDDEGPAPVGGSSEDGGESSGDDASASGDPGACSCRADAPAAWGFSWLALLLVRRRRASVGR